MTQVLSDHCTPRGGGRKGNSLPFAAPPHALIADSGLTPTDKVVAAALLFWARASETCWPSDATIGRRVGRSPGTVQRCLRRLEAGGWIAREKTSANRTGRLIRLAWRAGGGVPTSPGARPPLPSAREAPAAPARDKEDVIVKEPQGRGEGSGERQRSGLRPPASSIPQAGPKLGIPALSAAGAARPPHPSPSVIPQTPPASGREPAGRPTPPVPLSPGEAARLGEVSGATRERVLAWLATGDPVLMAEARKLLSQPPESRPAPASTAELLARIREDPRRVAQAAELLARDFEDRKSWTALHARCKDAWEGRLEPAALAAAYRQAIGPKARNRGAIFMHVLKRSPG